MMIRTNDNRTYQGADEREIVQAMMIDSWNSPPTKDEYMVSVATRVYLEQEAVINTQQPADFLSDLQQLGYLNFCQ